MSMPGSRGNKEVMYKLKKKELRKETSDQIDKYFTTIMENLMILIGKARDEHEQEVLRKDIHKLQYIQNVINSLYE